MIRFSLLLFLFIHCLQSEAQSIFARADGDWDNTNTWSTTGRTGATCSCIPDATDDVNIDGYDVYVTNSNAVANSIEVTNVLSGGAALLVVENGFNLSIDFDLTITANSNGDNVSLLVQDDGSELDIDDDLIVDLDAGERISITMTDSSFVDIAGDFNADMAGTTSEDLRMSLSCDDGNDNFHVVGDFIINKSDAQEVRIVLSNDAELQVDNDFIANWTGVNGDNHDFLISMTDSSLFDVEGSMSLTMNETGNTGNDIRLDIDNTANIEIGQNDGALLESLTINIIDGNEIDIELDGDAVGKVYGNVNITQDGDDDILIHLNQNSNGTANDAQFLIDGSLIMDQNDGDRIQIFADEHADILVGGKLDINATGQDGNDDLCEIQLSDDALLDVDSIFVVQVTRATYANIDFTIDLNNNSIFNIGSQSDDSSYISLNALRTIFLDMDGSSVFTNAGNCLIENLSGAGGGDVNLAIDGDAQWSIAGDLDIDDDSDDGLFFRLNQNVDGLLNDALVDVGGALTIDKTNNGEEFDLRIERDADLNVAGSALFSHIGNDYFVIYLNQGNNGGDSDGQFSIGGDLNISKTDGDFLYIYGNENSDIDIAGNFYISSSNMDGNGDQHEIQLSDNASIDVDGHFTYSISNTVSTALDLIFDLNDASVLNAGTANTDTFFLSTNNVRTLYLDFDNTSIATLSGKMTLFNSNGNVDADLDIELDRDAQLIVGGPVLLDHGGVDDLYIHMNQNANGASNDALFTINGDLTLNNSGDYTQIYMDRDAVFTINGEANIDHSGTNGLYIRSNIANAGGGSDVQFTINGNMNVTKSDGDIFYLFADEDSDIDINGNLEVISTNVDGNDDHHEIQVRDDASIDIDGSLTILISRAAGDANIDMIIDLENNAQLLVGTTVSDSVGLVQNNGRDVYLQLDGDALFDVSGNFYLEQNGFDDVLIYLNQNADGSANDVQFLVDGYFKVDKNDGDRLYLFMRRDSDLDIAGKLELISTNIDGDDLHSIRIYDDALLDTDESLTFYANRTAGPANADLEIDMDGNGQLVVGSTAADSVGFTLINGRESRLAMDADALLSVPGKFDWFHNGSDDLLISLNVTTNGTANDAQLNIGEDFIINKVDGDVFRIYGYEDSDINIGGQLLLNSSNIDGAGDHHYISLLDDATLDVEESVTLNASSIAISDWDFYINMDNASSFLIGSSVNDSLYLGTSNGRDIDFELDRDAILTVAGKVRIDQNGYDDVFVHLNQNANGALNDVQFTMGKEFDLLNNGDETQIYVSRDAVLSINGNLDIDHNGTNNCLIRTNVTADGGGTDARIIVNGDLLVNKTDGDAFYILAYQNSIIDVSGKMEVYSTNVDGDNDHHYLRAYDNGTIDIDESATLDISRSAGNANIDFYLDIEDAGQILIGTDANDSLFVSLNNGRDIDFRIDGDGILDVSGNMQFDFDGFDDIIMFFNQNADGAVNDAHMEVGGNFLVDMASGDDIAWYTSRDATIDIDGNMNINFLGADDFNFRLNQSLPGNSGDCRVNIGGNLDFTNAIGSGLFLQYIDDDAQLNILGDYNIDYNGDEYFYIYMNQSVDGATDDAQLNVGGNFVLDKSDGDQFRIFIEDDADIDVEGDMTINNTAHDAGGQHDEIQIENDALIDVEGDFSFTLNSTGFNDNDMIIDMSQSGAFEIGTNDGALAKSMTLKIDLGDDLIWDLDNSSSTRVYGDLNIIKNAGDLFEIELNENAGTDAEIHVYGDLDLDNVENAEIIYFQLDETASLLDVNGDIDFMGIASSGRAWIDLESTSKLELGGSILRNASPSRFGLISSEIGTTIEYNGTSTQVFADNDGDAADSIGYQLVVINNSGNSSPHVTMEDDVTLSYNINFVDGVLQTTPTELLIIADDATSNGGSDSSYVDGPMRKLGNDAFEFPIGDTIYWSRLGISAPFNTSTAFEAQYFRKNPNKDSYDTSLHQPSINNVSGLDYWILNKISAGADSVFVTLRWENSWTNRIDDLNDLKVVRWDSDSTKWIDHWQSATTGGADSLDSGSIVSNFRIQKFSPFTFGSGSSSLNPLPVTLTSFTANPVGDIVEIKWVTQSEINNDYFVVERSIDGSNFEPIAEILGAGNSRQELHYEMIDSEPELNGYSYYRLKQVDYNGSYSYSQIEVVYFSETVINEISLYPNPTSSGKLFVLIPDVNNEWKEIALLDIRGNIISKKPSYFSETGLSEYIVPETPGMYILRISVGSVVYNRRIIVQ